MSSSQKISFEHLPRIVSELKDEIIELKSMIINVPKEPSGDEWMDLDALCAYHSNHPTKKTVYDWVTHKRIPYHKDGHRLRFLKSEIDKWLQRGRHDTEDRMQDIAIRYINEQREASR